MFSRWFRRRSPGTRSAPRYAEALEQRRLLAYSLLTDINTQPVSITGPPYAPSEALELDGFAIFGHINVSQNIELWRTDGTAGGTAMVEDLKAGYQPSFPRNFVRAGNLGYFIADVQGGSELYRSDGTAEGTYPVRMPGVAGFASAVGITPVGNKLYFFSRHPTLGVELFVTEGTEATTTFVKDVTLNSASTTPDRTGTDGTRLFFETANTLWVSDGTTAGTKAVKNAVEVVTPIVGSGGFAYFGDGTGNLRRTDGTDAGTVIVASNVGRVLEIVDVGGGTLYFTSSASATNTTPSKLWRYANGTAQQVAQANGTNVTALPTSLTAVGSTLYFTSSPGATGLELWRVPAGGTAAIVQDLAPGSASSDPTELTNVNGTLYFRAYVGGFGLPKLLKVAGPTTGATTLAELRGASGIPPGGFSPFGSQLLFYNYDLTAGWELWKSDGTVPGTAMIANANPSTAGSNPTGFTKFGDGYLFAADDGVRGRELWYSDGTPGGTRIVKDINPGSASSSPGYPVVHGSRAFFTAVDAAGNELWVTDGTAAGTYRVKDINAGPGHPSIWSLTSSGDYVFFAANDGVHGNELWRSDGTPDGTIMLGEIRPGTADAEVGVASMGDGTVVLTANDGVRGRELWRSDGTPAGTYLLRDINTDPAAPFGGSPGHFTMVGGVMYFTAIDVEHGREVWKTDGTPGGTALVADVAPGPTWSTPAYHSNYDPAFIEYRGHVYFEASGSAGQGGELWRTDGTQAGTTLVKQLFDGSAGGEPRSFRVVDDKLYFIANSAADFFNPNPKLWVSDGTSNGTVQIPTDHLTSYVSFLHVANGQMFFIGPVPPTSHHELFTTDGTAAGTQRVTTLGDGRLSSSVQYQVWPVGDGSSFIFNMNDDVYGGELWRLEDTWSPRAGSARLDNSAGDAVVIRASERLSAVDPSKVAVVNVATGAPVNPATIQAQFAAGADDVRLAFTGQPGGRLPTGRYRVTVAPGGLTDVAGNTSATPFTFEFFTVGQGGAGGEHYRLRRGAGDNLLVYAGPATAGEPTTLAHTVPLAGLDAFAIHGGAGDDVVTLDWAGGEVLPWDFLTLDGGDGADRLVGRGASAADRFTADATGLWHGDRRVDHARVEQLTFAGGAVHVRRDLAGMRLTVDGPGAAAFFDDANQHLGGLQLLSGARATAVANGGRVIVTDDLSVDGASRLDLADNALVVRNASHAAALATHASVNGFVRNAFNDFAWDRPGITSSTAQADTANGTPSTLGILLNNDGGGGGLFYGDGTDQPTFMGAAVDGNTVMVRFTRLGDGDLNGMVDSVDFALFQAGYTGAAPYVGFAFGDYDFNGAVDSVDFGLFQAGYQPGPGSATALTEEDEQDLPVVGSSLSI